MFQGTVKWFNATKGFGFIEPKEGEGDVFVHITALNGLRIDEGDVVSYDLQEGKKGYEAVNVAMVEKNPNPPVRRSFGGGDRAPRSYDDNGGHRSY